MIGHFLGAAGVPPKNHADDMMETNNMPSAMFPCVFVAEQKQH